MHTSLHEIDIFTYEELLINLHLTFLITLVRLILQLMRDSHIHLGDTHLSYETYEIGTKLVISLLELGTYIIGVWSHNIVGTLE